MKLLIAYASKNGTVRECAMRLRDALSPVPVTLSDLERESPDPDEYDVIVVGAAVHYEKLHKPVRLYLDTHRTSLKSKQLCLFLCCGLPHESEYYMEHVYPKDLAKCAYQSMYFGGSLRTDHLSFFDKLVVKHLRSSIAQSEIEDGEYTPSMPGILPENIERMATYIRHLKNS